MKAIFLVLAAAASMLAGCETTESIDKTPRVASAAGVSGTPARRVVRMAPIADDDVAVSRRVRREAVAAASAPAASPTETATVDDTASAAASAETAPAPTTPSSAAASAAASVHAAPPSEAATASVPEVVPPATAELSAPAAPAEPTPAPATETTSAEPDRQVTLSTRALTEQLPALFEAKIGGMPLWLVIVVSVVLLAAVAIGMGSSRKPKEEI